VIPPGVIPPRMGGARIHDIKDDIAGHGADEPAS
jgi:hypothetical protein